ncbi:type II toxin-antitoxin system mRNA interferase toxin, RelE/StbE family [Clostridium sp. MCC353]|uniref:type II toxin-antitoxin system YafQ family toxin n=1 Tax=Clostridium sp. MCC353 TaxID=2592646 RepID=UPI001C018C91|nr:type II toxin-antitoxin system YafQ family toxin [Clostridium sp. MCC353]MBT9778144.1 type II toxin-antitoxin system mRNA interferase toxin, RelE/StbE family [Clostridium sp. MCC353]
MSYQLILTNKFKKGLKLAKRRGLDITLLETLVEKLLHGIPLDEKNKDHELKGKFKGFRECHIQPDWLLIYLVEDEVLTLTLIDTGTHADLFNM